MTLEENYYDRKIRTDRLTFDVKNEMSRQFEKWGQQDHPFYAEGWDWLSQGYYQGEATTLQRLNDNDAPARWDYILLEEVYEALAERDSIKREEELIQVAAVALSMVAASERARRKLPSGWTEVGLASLVDYRSADDMVAASAKLDADLRTVAQTYTMSIEVPIEDPLPCKDCPDEKPQTYSCCRHCTSDDSLYGPCLGGHFTTCPECDA